MGRFDYFHPGDDFAPSASQFNEFVDTARKVRSLAGISGSPFGEFNDFVWYHAKTTSALSAGSYTSPTTCTFNVWDYDEDSVLDPQPLIVSTDPDLLSQTLENYWNITVSSGIQIAVIRDYRGKWHLVWADC